MSDSKLDDLVRELEDTATRLRSGELQAEEAAGLVDRCAELALEIGSALDQTARRLPDEGQEQLL